MLEESIFFFNHRCIHEPARLVFLSPIISRLQHFNQARITAPPGHWWVIPPLVTNQNHLNMVKLYITTPLSVLLGITSDAGSMTAGLAPSISFPTLADMFSLGKMLNLIKTTNYGEN